MQKIIVLLFSLFITSVSAQVSTCILDGGGSVSDRVCGTEEAVGAIRNIYSNLEVRSRTNILTGHGSNRGPSCTTPMLGCTNPEVASTCSADALNSSTWDEASGRYIPVVPTAQLTTSLSARRGERIRGASQESFDRNCLFNSSSPPQNKIPVCHFWNLNHGSPQGSLFYREEGAEQTYMSNDMIAGKAEHCRTFRYVTHSCYGGQLANLIYGPDRRVLPGRCGISAMPPGYTAPGYNSISTSNGPGHRMQRTRFSQ